MIRVVVFVLLTLLALVTGNLPRHGLGLIGGVALLMWITDWLVGLNGVVYQSKPR